MDDACPNGDTARLQPIYEHWRCLVSKRVTNISNNLFLLVHWAGFYFFSACLNFIELKTNAL